MIYENRKSSFVNAFEKTFEGKLDEITNVKYRSRDYDIIDHFKKTREYTPE